MDFLFSSIARDLILWQVNDWPYARHCTRLWAQLRAKWSQCEWQS